MSSSKKIETKGSLIEVAVVQMEPKILNKKDNIKISIQLIKEAASNGAKLVVLPELCNTGYMFNSREEAYSVAEEIPNGHTIEVWKSLSNELNVYISAGIAEIDGCNLYNTSVLIGPDGFIGKYRKIHLWNEEKLFFEPGNLGFPVFNTPIGKIGSLICYDMWFPEAWRLLALQGADIITINSNWISTPFPEGEKPMAINIAKAMAHTNVVFIAASNRIGIERGQEFLGHSAIISPGGWCISGPSSKDKMEILYADCNLSSARKLKIWNNFNGPIKDRRTDVYDSMLGYEGNPFAF